MDFSEQFSLKGKIALVTGASYGIGFAIAKGLAAAGATIVFNDIKQELVDKGLEAYKAEGIEAKGYVCDVTSEEQVNALVATIEKEVGVIDILVNNAGIIKRIPMCDMSAADFRAVIDVDLNAPFIVAKAVIPAMIKKGGGKIINICSMMSELGRETVSAYAAAKGGLKMLTKNIASEYGEYNIQCNGIGPGYIATPQTAPLRETQPDGSRHPFDKFIISKTPAARWGDPEGTAIMKSERGIPLSKAALENCKSQGLLNEMVAEANAKVLDWVQFPLDTTFESSKLKGNPDGVYYDALGGLSYKEYTPAEAAEVLVKGISDVLAG